ncbi:MAG: UDP-N-acetylmuramoyl-tripeptide--D-alanyl-D-alanine ligase [Desulfobacterales bacterium]
MAGPGVNGKPDPEARGTTWRLAEVLRATGGECLSGPRETAFGGVSTDTRSLRPGELFVALRGERHDGHDFVAEALRRGAAGVLVEARATEAQHAARGAGGRAALIAVADTLRALGDLASFHRRRRRAFVLAITGSNGKTTTRRMTAAVLARRYAVLEPERNWNNLVGVPLTLLRLEPGHEAAVLELGTNRPGEIARLTEICAPDAGLITNIGPAHLEGLGSLEGVLAEKAALVYGLAPDRSALLNADDPLLRRLGRECGRRVILFGTGEEAHVRAAGVEVAPGRTAFDLATDAGNARVELPVAGACFVGNALAAAAAGRLLGLPPEEIAAGLAAFRPAPGRLEIRELPGGITVIDDSYNANPASVRAAIETLSALRGAARGIVVLGEMRELGAGAAAWHREAGRLAAQSGAARLYACGPWSGEVARGACEAGLSPAAVVTGGREEIGAALRETLRPGDWVLVKGSRAAAMEAIVEMLSRRTPREG